ncbi:NfeD family protein [Lamprobacter modestohalophilus]|nr:NfeD family protein [Lamprobacter modestohalophilus]
MEALFATSGYWGLAGALFIALELLLPGLYSIWIGVGALVVSLVLMMFPALSTTAQLQVFASAMMSTLGLGFLIQRRGGRRVQTRPINQELQGLIDQTLLVASAFDAGRVRVADTTYAAFCEQPLGCGEQVIVRGIEGGRLRVAPKGDDKSSRGVERH